MGKTYKDTRGFVPTNKPKVKGSQKNKRAKIKEIKIDNEEQE